MDLFAALINRVLLASPLVIKKPPKIDVAAPTMTEALKTQGFSSRIG